MTIPQINSVTEAINRKPALFFKYSITEDIMSVCPSMEIYPPHKSMHSGELWELIKICNRHKLNYYISSINSTQPYLRIF